MNEVKTNIPDGEMVNNLYMIPYVTHCERMSKAYKREKLLKALLITSNVLWLIWFVFSFVVG